MQQETITRLRPQIVILKMDINMSDDIIENAENGELVTNHDKLTISGYRASNKNNRKYTL